MKYIRTIEHRERKRYRTFVEYRSVHNLCRYLYTSGKETNCKGPMHEEATTARSKGLSVFLQLPYVAFNNASLTFHEEPQVKVILRLFLFISFLFSAPPSPLLGHHGDGHVDEEDGGGAGRQQR